GPTKANRAERPLRRPASTSRAAAMLRAVSEPGPAIATSHDPSRSGNLSRVGPALPLDCSISYIIDMMRLLSMDTTLYMLINILTRAYEYAHADRKRRGNLRMRWRRSERPPGRARQRSRG